MNSVCGGSGGGSEPLYVGPVTGADPSRASAAGPTALSRMRLVGAVARTGQTPKNPMSPVRLPTTT